MQNLKSWAIAGAIVALLPVFSASAADTLKLITQVMQDREVVGADGKVEHKILPVDHVPPGAEVMYVVTYHNVGTKPAENVVVDIPVPKDLEYRLDSATAPNVEVLVSVDGGKKFAALTGLRVADTDGNVRSAQAADVSNVRWKLKTSVKPGQEGSVSFRAVVR